MKKNDYKKAGTYYFIGNLFNKGIAFLTVPIFTRILSTSDYGIINTYGTWISIISIFVSLAIYMGIRASFIDYRDNIDDFLSTCTTFTLLNGFSVSLIFIIISRALTIKISTSLLFLCAIQSVATAILQNYSMYLMMQFRYKFRTALMILPNLVSVIISIILIVFFINDDKYLGRIVPQAIVHLIIATIVIILIYKSSNRVFNKEYLKYALAISTPLVLHGISLNILSQSDRTMITWLADAGQSGIYSLVYNFSMIATVITTSLDGIWVPWFTKSLMESKETEINSRAKKYIDFMTIAMISVMLIGPEAVKILAPVQYWDGISIIPPIVISNFVIFAYTLYVNIEHYYKKTPYITINTIIAACSNLILNYIFIPKYGYVAAAYTTLASYLLSFILHSNYSRSLNSRLYPIKTFAIPLAEIAIAVSVFCLFKEMWFIRWMLVVLFLALSIYINRTFLYELLPERLKR